MTLRARLSFVYRRALFVGCAGLLQLNAHACKRTESNSTRASDNATVLPATESNRLRVFLDDCGFAGWSMIEGATFLHLVAPDDLQKNSNLRPLAVRVARDGSIDFGASAIGARVYGAWPRSAWLQASNDTNPTAHEFSNWNGSTWVKDTQMGPSVMTVLPWRDGTSLRVERQSFGTRLAVHDNTHESAKLRVPPELERFDSAAVFTLPKTGMAVMTGAVDGRTGYTVVAGATTAVLRNSVGSSIAAVSSSCDRVLLSQWVDGAAESPEPRPRAVRIGEGRVTPGEQLPAEPAHLAIDRHCHEWLVSSDGDLFEKESPSAGWQKRSLTPEGTAPRSTAIATTGDRVWVAIGPALFAVRAGQSEKVELPVALGPQGAAIFLASDEQGDRLWAAVLPVNEKRGTILTTGPVPEKMRCEHLANKIGTK